MLSAVYYWDFWGYRAAFVLIAIYPLSSYLFTSQRPATRAAVLTLLGSIMFAPELAAFDFPLLPPLDKYSIAALSALIGAFRFARSRVRAAKLFRHPLDYMVLGMMGGAVGTWLTNQDFLRYGSWHIVFLQGLTWYDAASLGLGDIMNIALPFFLGRIFMRSSKDVRIYMILLASAGLLYSIPILYETRMSPMLHSNFYGFQARNDWIQNMRQGGYRATVFMAHGLVVAFFMCLTFIAALSLRKSGRRQIMRLKIELVLVYLFVILVLCKSSNALIFSIVSAPVLLWGGVKTQLRLAMLFALCVFAYPITRGMDWFPADDLVEISKKYGSEDRAASLQFRFDNEDVLLMKGMERIWFGWGAYGRERIYDAGDGKDLTTQDGHWIIVFGQRGTVGFTMFYGIMLIPIFMTAFGLRKVPNAGDRALLSGLAYIISLCAVNTLPNMFQQILPFFMSGGLVALLNELPKERAQAEARAQKAQADAASPQAA